MTYLDIFVGFYGKANEVRKRELLRSLQYEHNNSNELEQLSANCSSLATCGSLVLWLRLFYEIFRADTNDYLLTCLG